MTSTSMAPAPECKTDSPPWRTSRRAQSKGAAYMVTSSCLLLFLLTKRSWRLLPMASVASPLNQSTVVTVSHNSQPMGVLGVSARIAVIWAIRVSLSPRRVWPAQMLSVRVLRTPHPRLSWCRTLRLCRAPQTSKIHLSTSNPDSTKISLTRMPIIGASIRCRPQQRKTLRPSSKPSRETILNSR